MEIRLGSDRGFADHGWLRSFHTFSFAEYFDPKHMGFRALRVINEDRVAAGQGFGRHPHRDMEIVSYVLAGELEHKDSLGNGQIIRPGDVQRMTAGTGVLHSEFNPSATAPVHFLQIWIEPGRRGLAPGYEQRHFSVDERRGRLRLVGSQDGRDGSITIHQDVNLYAGLLDSADVVSYAVPAGRHAWVHVARGELSIGDRALEAGDAVSANGGEAFELRATGEAEVLVFDLA